MHANKNTNLDDMIYHQLKTMANKLMVKERKNHTLSPTDLVHEAFVKLSDCDELFLNKKHYFRTLARQMRRVLIDYGRKNARLKNKNKVNNLTYTDSMGLLDSAVDFSYISDALEELEMMDSSSAEAIDLVYFAALPQPQAAEYLNISLSTLERNLKFGRAYINEFIHNLGLVSNV